MSYSENIRLTIAAFPLLLLCLLLNSCDDKRIYEKNIPIPSHQWSYQDIKTFSVEIDDTAQRYNIALNIRHHYLYAWRNMWVNVETVYPDSSSRTSAVELPMADAAGNFYSYCAGDICDLQIPIQQNAIFPQKGVYRFKVKQHMRVDPLDHVFAVGLRLEIASDTH